MLSDLALNTEAVNLLHWAQGGHVGSRIGLDPEQYEQDLRRVVQLGFHATFDERRKLAKAMYAPDAEFWHPLAIVRGHKRIAGIYQLWCTLNRRVEADVTRVGARTFQSSASSGSFKRRLHGGNDQDLVLRHVLS